MEAMMDALKARIKDLEHRLSLYDSACATDGIEGRDAVIADLRRQLAAKQQASAP